MNLHIYAYGGLLLVCAGLYAWVSIESGRADTKQAEVDRYKTTVIAMQASIDQAKLTNQQNVEAIKSLEADLQRQTEVSLRFEDQARKRDAKLNAVLKGISNAPATDDGAVAPVLARELERLRADFAAADGAHPNSGRAPAGAGDKASVPNPP